MMGKFETEALTYFGSDYMKGHIERLDSTACFSPLSEYWFWKFRLKIMAWQGKLIVKKHRNIWASVNGMPMYGLPQ